LKEKIIIKGTAIKKGIAMVLIPFYLFSVSFSSKKDEY